MIDFIDKNRIMEITFSMLAQTVIAALLVTVGIVCYMYGDEEEIIRHDGTDAEDREAG